MQRNDTSIPATHGHAHAPTSRRDLIKLSIAALGVVYGDIGTSPLYAVKDCFHGVHGVAPTHANILGILSLIFWALTIVIVIKYLTFIMRADNRGEGGILALLALVSSGDNARKNAKSTSVMIMLGLFGASLLLGEGMLTPAISVLSAVEGLKRIGPRFENLVVPITCVILVALFLAQKRGTLRVGAIFGPTTLVWFITIAAIAIPWIRRHPEVVGSINPIHGVRFFLHNGKQGFFVLGSVVLCITGGEALYADMGHFGKKPIRFAWYFAAYPALLLNYWGQGALLWERGSLVERPFYELVSGWMLYPLIGIATLATIVASQALISGAYSLTQQAVQLGYSPRVSIVHTSEHAEGQIYIPEINTMLMVACLTLVLAFRESDRLTAAYGIAVTGTMSITSILFFALAVRKWGWSPWRAGALVAVFLAIDLSFFSANLFKFFHGGWVPIAMASCLFTIMTTWKRGRAALGAYMMGAALPLEMFMADVEETKPHRVPGSAVFMTSNPDGAPPVLLHHFKHNQVLHEQVILLSVQTSHDPEVHTDERVKVRDVGHGFYQVTASYGFMQTPNVLDILACCAERGLVTEPQMVSYYLGRETLLTTGRSGMSRWRKALFGFLSRNARPATAFFRIPANRVVELGIQIEL